MVTDNNVDLLLKVGKELAESGAESTIIEECMNSLAQKLELDEIGISVLPKSIFLTLLENGQYKTKVQHLDDVIPDFRKLTEIYRLCQKDSTDNIIVIKSGLSLILHTKQHSKIRFLTTPLALFAFAIIFGADFIGAITAGISGLFAYITKERLLHRNMNIMITNLLSAFVATISSYALANWLNLTNISIIQASAVIFLVPGVPLINSLEDMLKGHYLNGVARGMRAFFLTLGVVIGIIMALTLQNFIAKSILF